jgi:hypothetical protein
MEGGSLHGFIHASPGRRLTCSETVRVAGDVASAMAGDTDRVGARRRVLTDFMPNLVSVSR